MPEGQISVVSIPVRDQERAKEFYAEKLGFEVVQDDQFGEQRWVMLRPVGGRTAITLVTWFKEMKPGGVKGLILSVQSIERAIADMRMRGAPLTNDSIQEAPWGRWVSIEDPDGNGWIIQQDLLMEKEPEG